jgi:hypothetical protein
VRSIEVRRQHKGSRALTVKKRTTFFDDARTPGHVLQMMSSVMSFISLPVHVHPALYSMSFMLLFRSLALPYSFKPQLSSAAVEN